MTRLDEFVTLGRSGLRVSPLTLGSMNFGEDWGFGADPETSHQILAAYLDAGGNSIDTANSYTNCHSEKIIGDYFAAHPGVRDRVVLGTKFFSNLHRGDPNAGGAGRKSIVRQVEESLRRLRTDWLDILWLHAWDHLTPIEETMRALDDLVRDGKARYLGFSDVPAWVASEAQTLARLRGWTPVTALQLEYSLLERGGEAELWPMAAEHGIGVMPFSPLQNGRLTGKYRRDRLDPDDAKRTMMAAGVTDAEWQVIDELLAVADEIGAPPAAVAIAWVAGRPGVGSTLIGPRMVEQLKTSLAALDVTLDEGQRARLDAVSAPDRRFLPVVLEEARRFSLFPGMTVDGEHYPDNPLMPAGSPTY